ncbi:M56 family metallopeptidase [Phenylobacterium sp.]|uniref:M56 family metallopeptidase n=1 Tax=Phenylobacterium sp. TaxID=1871053 RepID=UPI0025D46496|nr:M56 family metallopeptidase [Phenylobacterium sp.]
MTASDLLLLVVRANLVAAAAIGLILALRPVMTRRFDPRVTYALWALAPLAVMASLLPARRVVIAAGSMASRIAENQASALPPPALVPKAVSLAAPLFDPVPWLVGAWALGALLSLGLLAWRQYSFGRSLGTLRREAGVYRSEARGVGPAVVGALRPRIVVPADFEARFEPEERDVVLAHEQAHFRRGDPLANAMLALGQCLFWLNPLVHVAAHYVRLDQELACDAAVIARFPGARKRYAEAMLKTQLAPMAAPLACYWPGRSAHPMKHRIAMLKAAPAAGPRRTAGLALVGVLSLGVGLAAWAAQPARIETRRVTITGPAPAEVEAARRRADAAAVEAEAQRRSAAEAHAAAEAERRQVERQRVATDWEVRAGERSARLAEIRRAMAEQRRAEADARAGLAEQSAVAAEQARVESEVARVAAEQARVAVESALRDSRASMRIADQTRAAVTSAVLSAVGDELSRQGVAR